MLFVYGDGWIAEIDGFQAGHLLQIKYGRFDVCVDGSMGRDFAKKPPCPGQGDREVSPLQVADPYAAAPPRVGQL